MNEKTFLIAGHIAKWANNKELRGDLTNGICFCLMHDKVFERGLFTLTLDFKIWVYKPLAESSLWARKNLLPFDGIPIKPAHIFLSSKANQEHWMRNNIEV